MPNFVLFCAVIAQLAAAVPTPATGAHRPAVLASPRAAASATVASLRRVFPTLDVEWKSDQPGPALVTGLHVPTTGADTTARGLDFLQRHAALVPLGAATLHAEPASESRARRVARFELTVPGPAGPAVVLDRSVAVAMDRDGNVLHVVSDAVPVAAAPLWRLSPDRALRHVAMAGHAVVPGGRPRAAVVAPTLATPAAATPIWVVDIGGPLDPAVVLVDATSGSLLGQRSSARR